MNAARRHEDLSAAVWCCSVQGEAGQGKAEEFEALAVVSLAVMEGGRGQPWLKLEIW